MPIVPDVTEAVVGPNYHKVIYEDQDVRVSGRRCWTRDAAEVSS